jgi:light-regulated signal transduction histidine kinase (bacteriophytochrome)
VDSEGRVTRVIEHNVDVTERKRIEEELRNHEKSLEMLVATLERSNQELRSFATVAAHDIRSPMAVVSTSAGLLKDMLAGKLDANSERVLDILIRSGERTTEMIAALYRCSQVDSGAMSQAPVDLNRIVEEVTSLRLAVDIRNLQGTIHVPERLHVVRGDEMQILQLVQNFIANGLNYRRKNIDPEITIRSCEVAHDRIRLEVEDNGIGIRDADRGKLFRMFTRLGGGREEEGLGLGLALCKKVADRHGGRIGVTSGDDAGSTFWVELPQATEGDLAECR